ncbi:hypothetical protein CYMTET_15684 [Cymbomonas tetramitiformis]|uniref:Uncharacterized protein n=1 Tax=Cymbomonas tetramitiformis TaxID=36881 RepID=A0AAE0L934_9CHLO|nr:hypothetical protein CYMTET_15684 [Cymbomonas tetramitiformis]
MAWKEKVISLCLQRTRDLRRARLDVRRKGQISGQTDVPLELGRIIQEEMQRADTQVEPSPKKPATDLWEWADTSMGVRDPEASMGASWDEELTQLSTEEYTELMQMLQEAFDEQLQHEGACGEAK